MVKELISVIIPVYNRAQLLPRALRSVLSQTYSDLEIIIVDDASTDAPFDAVLGIVDERVEYIRFSENKGVSAARNAGIKKAKGDYIAFLDSDDEWLPEKIALSLQIFQEKENFNLGLVQTNGWLIKNGEKRRFFQNLNGSGLIYGDKERKENIFPTRITSPGPPFWLLAKKTVEKIGFFEENMSNWEDVDFFVRVAAEFDIYYLNQELVKVYEQERHLGEVNSRVMGCKDYFWQKHYRQMSKDKFSVYRFIWRMGKDWLALGNKRLARRYFLQALKNKPYKLEIIGKLFNTL